MYKVADVENENKLYNPFDILGISTVWPHSSVNFLIYTIVLQGISEKEIKSHYKKLSKLQCVLYYIHTCACQRVAYSHPDKVKTTVNQTIAEVEKRFIDITKAYKA